MPRILVPVALALALGVTACGSSSSHNAGTPVDPNAKEHSPAGDIPDNQAFVAYSAPGGGYSVKVPEGWARTQAGGAVTFTDKLNSVRIESTAAKGPLTVAEATKTGKGRVSTLRRPAGTAVRIKYLTKSAPDPVTGRTITDAVERYVFFHNGRRVILTLSGPQKADNVDPWKLVSSSVRWTA
jgi:hypothetical protein